MTIILPTIGALHLNDAEVGRLKDECEKEKSDQDFDAIAAGILKKVTPDTLSAPIHEKNGDEQSQES